MRIQKTTDPSVKPSTLMLIYGEGGVGKTSFAATAPKPLLLDCENGAKYLGLRGIEMDFMQIRQWKDMEGVLEQAKAGGYETIVIDPIGELMDKLKAYMPALKDTKLIQKDGSPTMAGWGWLKKTMRNYIKLLRDSGLHILIIAHVDEKQDEDRIVKQPMIETKLSKELVNMVDIVGYMTIIKDGEETKRVIIVDPESDKFTAKDRTGQLDRFVEPNFSKIVKAMEGSESYAWMKDGAKGKEPKKNEPAKPEAPKTATPEPQAEAQGQYESKRDAATALGVSENELNEALGTTGQSPQLTKEKQEIDQAIANAFANATTK